jgi:hypothetical protein
MAEDSIAGNVMSLEECRRILGPDCTLSEAELKTLRSDLYLLAEVVVAMFLESGRIDDDGDARLRGRSRQ